MADNDSPETQTDDEPETDEPEGDDEGTEVGIDDLVERVAAAVVTKIGGKAPSTSEEPPAPGSGEGPGSGASDDPDIEDRVRSMMTKVLDEREHDAAHRRLDGPEPVVPTEPEPKPDRRGIAAAVFGRKR